MPLASPSAFRFSTADYAPQDRLAAWREVLGGSVHLHLDVESVADEPPRATVELHRWSTSSLYFSNTTPVRALRTPRLVQDGDGDFRLLRAEGAGYRFTSNGVDEVVNDGDAALLFNGVVGAVRYLDRAASPRSVFAAPTLPLSCADSMIAPFAASHPGRPPCAC